jgi:hypothetical protein
MKYYVTYTEYYCITVEAEEDADPQKIVEIAEKKHENCEEEYVDGQFESVIDENDNYVWEI